MLRLRVEVPDRAGSLAVLATTLATCEADVTHISVMHRSDTRAVDDIWLTQAAEPNADRIVTRLQEHPDIRVLGRRRGATPIEFDAQLDFLAYLFAAPQRSVEALVEVLPAVADADWAIIRDAAAPANAYESHLGPPTRTDRDEVVELSAPAGMTLLIGRAAGLPWHDAEVRRIVSVLELAAHLIAGAGLHEQRSRLTAQFVHGYARVGA